jgi:hypothetical protein
LLGNCGNPYVKISLGGLFFFSFLFVKTKFAIKIDDHVVCINFFEFIY